MKTSNNVLWAGVACFLAICCTVLYVNETSGRPEPAPETEIKEIFIKACEQVREAKGRSYDCRIQNYGEGQLVVARAERNNNPLVEDVPLRPVAPRVPRFPTIPPGDKVVDDSQTEE